MKWTNQRIAEAILKTYNLSEELEVVTKHPENNEEFALGLIQKPRKGTRRESDQWPVHSIYKVKNGYVATYIEYDPGVRYHSDGSGTPPSSEEVEFWKYLEDYKGISTKRTKGISAKRTKESIIFKDVFSAMKHICNAYIEMRLDDIADAMHEEQMDILSMDARFEGQ